MYTYVGINLYKLKFGVKVQIIIRQPYNGLLGGKKKK